jgi:molybdopterin molybdotransferase
MAQLSDDCFAFGGSMMSVDEAVGLIAARQKVGEIETAALAGADGRPRARYRSAPAAAAVHQFRRRWLCRRKPRSAEGRGGSVSRAAACRLALADDAIKARHAVRIFTGAPAGADTVFMQEDVRFEQGGASAG